MVGVDDGARCGIDPGAPCALEPFRNTPDLAAIDACVRKIITLRHHLAAAAERRTTPATPARPWVIALSPGDPVTARLEYGLTTPTWPGVYRAARGVGLVVVVLAELLVSRETLALRLLGRGPTLARALVELRALRRDAWEHRLVDVLLRWRREEQPTPTTPEDDTIMGALAELRAWRAQQDAQLRESGLLEGRHEGQLALLDRQLAHKLRRPLTEIERDALRARLAAQGDALADAVVDLDPPALEAWLAAPDANL